MSPGRLLRWTIVLAAPLLAGVLVASLGGCSVLPSPPSSQIYRLTPPIDDPQGRAPVRGALAVALPTAPESLDTDRIALTRGVTRFDYYADSVWTDRLPSLLQTLILEGFEDAGRIRTVTRSGYDVTAGDQLRTEIRRFEAQYPAGADAPPEIVVVLNFQLVSVPGEHVRGEKLVAVRVPAARNQLDAIVRAFDTATGEALDQGIAWTIGEMTPPVHRTRRR